MVCGHSIPALRSPLNFGGVLGGVLKAMAVFSLLASPAHGVAFFEVSASSQVDIEALEFDDREKLNFTIGPPMLAGSRSGGTGAFEILFMDRPRSGSVGDQSIFLELGSISAQALEPMGEVSIESSIREPRLHSHTITVENISSDPVDLLFDWHLVVQMRTSAVPPPPKAMAFAGAEDFLLVEILEDGDFFRLPFFRDARFANREQIGPGTDSLRFNESAEATFMIDAGASRTWTLFGAIDGRAVVVSEPSTFALFVLGLGGIGFLAIRRRRGG